MKLVLTSLAFFLLTAPVFAAERAVLIRPGNIYISPDTSAEKLGQVDRGRELIVLDTSREWLHVEANLTEERTVTGWVMGSGAVRTSTPNGDKVLFGEAADSEEQASSRHGRPDAAQDAMRLYYRAAEYFPNSPLAAEAMYRSADIRWQLEKSDIMRRPSARQQEAYLREGMEEKYMKEVIKKFSGTKWADMAAFELLDNKLCGDWQGASKCPEKEADLYLKYAKDHPQSPKTPEALYDAAYRYAALVEIYKTETQAKKSEESKSRALSLAQQVATQYPQSDWGARAQTLLFKLQQGIPAYGNEIQ